MKKMFTCLAALGMLLTMVPANTAFAAETASIVTMTSEFSPVEEEIAAGVSVAALHGFWLEADTSKPLVINEGSDLNNGKFDFIDDDGTYITGDVRLEYSIDANNNKIYFYNFYTNTGSLWNSFPVTGNLPLNELNPGQNGSMHFLRRLFRGKVVTQSGDLNLRSETNTSSLILTTIPRGTLLYIFPSSTDGWYRTEYAGEKGYVSAEFIENTGIESASVKLEEIVGKWRYEVADGGYTVEVQSKSDGIVEIKSDGTYTYVNAAGKEETGLVRTGVEEYTNGVSNPTVSFYKNSKYSFGGYYNHERDSMMYLGNGGMSRLVRIGSEDDNMIDVKLLAGKWKYEVSSGNYTVDKGAKKNGTVVINDDGTYTYTDLSGNVTNGRVITGVEIIGNTKHKTVKFDSGTVVSFGGYYNEDSKDISLGNGGMARLVRDNGEDDVKIDMKTIAGKWKYEVSSGNYTVDKGAKFNGTVEINEDGTYTYTDAEGKVAKGTIKTKVEKIAGADFPIVDFYNGTELSFGGYYNEDSKEISLGNGGLARLVRDNGIKVKLSGDANCDNKVDLSDSVLIMQSISNPSKYGDNGTDEHKITLQGKANADCCNTGDGVTNADALAIQKYKLALIKILPETKQ